MDYANCCALTHSVPDTTSGGAGSGARGSSVIFFAQLPVLDVRVVRLAPAAAAVARLRFPRPPPPTSAPLPGRGGAGICLGVARARAAVALPWGRACSCCRRDPGESGLLLCRHEHAKLWRRSSGVLLALALRRRLEIQTTPSAVPCRERRLRAALHAAHPARALHILRRGRRLRPPLDSRVARHRLLRTARPGPSWCDPCRCCKQRARAATGAASRGFGWTECVDADAIGGGPRCTVVEVRPIYRPAESPCADGLIADRNRRPTIGHRGRVPAARALRGDTSSASRCAASSSQA